MGKLASLKHNDFECVLKQIGFEFIRQKGSHAVWLHKDNRTITLPIHKGKTIKYGLAKKIITQDINISIEDFFIILRGKK